MSKVLMFHRVLPQHLIKSPNAYSDFGTLISQEYFKEVLEIIVDNDFEFVTISKLTELNSRQVNTDKFVALTFDDGYCDNFDFAIPILQSCSATATFFPVVNPCRENSVLPLDTYYQCVDEMCLSQDKRNEYVKGDIKKQFYWEDPEKQVEILKEIFHTLPTKPKVGYVTDKQLKELSNNGYEIGSHGMTHSLLIADYMNEETIEYELQNSKKWLEEVTSKPVTSYCFPAGRYNNNSVRIAKAAGYTSTCLVYRNEDDAKILPSYERIFVKPNSLNELKSIFQEQ